MSVRVTVLGSGSSGNCTLVATPCCRILLDAGFGPRTLAYRLRQAGLEPDALDAIFISHEHSDHIGGGLEFSEEWRVPIFLSQVAFQCLPLAEPVGRRENLTSCQTVSIKDIQVTPFPVPHDAVDPFAFQIEAEGIQIALVTDLGHLSETVKGRMRHCHILIIESNHDTEMLKVGPYPWSLKQRVLSSHGHLSNEALAEYLSGDYDGEATHIVLAHLSQQNNHPDIALASARRALGRRARLFEKPPVLVLTHQNRPSENIVL